MKTLLKIFATINLFLLICTNACSSIKPPQVGNFKVLAVETFLGDIAKNVAGDRIKVDT